MVMSMAKIKYTQEQIQAIEAEAGNLLISASAGTGKTTVMTERIVKRILANDLSLDKTLILTFTNAASQDMRQKLENKLLAYQDAAAANNDRDLELKISRELTYLSAAHIETIHAFCLYIIQKFPELLTDKEGKKLLDANFATASEEESDELLNTALDRTLDLFFTEAEEKRDSADSAERKFSDDALKLSQIYSSGRSNDKLKDLLIYIYNFLRAIPDYKSRSLKALDALEYNAKNFEKSPHIKYLFEGLKLRTDVAYEEIPELARELETIKLIKNNAEKDQAKKENYYEIFRAVNEVHGLLENLENKDLAKLWDEIYAIKSKLVFDKPRRVGVNVKNEKTRMENIRKNEFIDKSFTYLVDFLYYLDVPGSTSGRITELNRFPLVKVWTADIKEISTEATKMIDLIRMLFDLVFLLDEEYAKEKSRHNLIDFNDYEHFALRIIRTEAGKAYCREQFTEVYIDEYQDTSSIEEAILSQIAPDNTFMVGDVKQSIYRFRAARPEIFIAKANEFKENNSGRLLGLNENFRSQVGVLAGVNEIFSRIMTTDFTGIDYINAHQLKSGSSKDKVAKRVEFMLDLREKADDYYFLDENGDFLPEIKELKELKAIKANPEDWAREHWKIKNIFHVAKEVWRLHTEENVPFKDIAILSRNNPVADDVAKIFQALHIPQNRELKTKINENFVLENQIALLRTLDNVNEDIPLATLMLSQLLEASFNETELLKIRIYQEEQHKEGNFYQAVKLLANADLKEDAEFYELSKKLQRFLKNLNYWRERRSKVAVSTLLSEIWNKVDYLNLVNIEEGYQAVLALEEFLAKLINVEKEGQKGLTFILQSLEDELEEDKFSPNENNLDGDGVNILTIHKSKGLDFPYVFLYDLSKGFNLKDTKQKLILSENLGIGFDIADISEFGVFTRPSHIKLAMNSEEKQRNLSEEISLLYVALTRAQEKVYLCGELDVDNYSGRESANSIQSLLNLAKDIKGPLPAYILEEANSYQDYILLALSSTRDKEKLKFLDYFKFVKDKSKEAFTSQKFSSANWSFNIYNNQEDLKEIFREIIAHFNELEASDLETQSSEEATVSPEKLIQFYKYPEKEIKTITKRSVSEIKRASMLNENLDQEEASFTSDINLDMTPLSDLVAEAQAEKALSASELGIALHASFAYLDLKKVQASEDQETEVQRQIKELADNAFLTDLEAQSILGFTDELLAFANSRIAKLLLEEEASAKKDNRLARIYKELPFTFRYEDQEAEQTYLIQGVIDLWFMHEDKLYLLDYKSDHLSSDINKARATLLERYKIQLKLYAAALEADLNKEVDEILIWSIRLKRSFSFTREKLGLA